MKYILFFITFTLYNSSFAQFNTENLCELFNQTTGLNYHEVFTEEFQQFVPEDQMKEILDQIKSKNGNCLSSDLVQKYFPIVSPNWHYLHFTNGKSGLFKVILNQDNHKISGFRFSGITLNPSKMKFKEMNMKTRDGELLKTHVFLTSSRTKKETIMARTPYFFIRNEYNIGTLLQASFYIEHGYHFVFQAIRGTGGSTGEALLFNPQEAADGADLVRWIRRQGFSNGRIAAVGTSYEGLTALAAGIENPRGLKLIISGAGPVDASTGTFNINGLLILSLLDYVHYFTTSQGEPFTGSSLSEKLNNLATQEFDLSKYDEVIFNKNISEWDRWVTAWQNHEQNFWQSRSLLQYLKNIKTPVILTAGLKLDGNMPDTINNFLRLKPSPDHRLVLGYWDHGNNTPYNDGSNMSPMIAERFNLWLEHYLKDNPQKKIKNEAPILIQSHFSNEPVQFKKLSEVNAQSKLNLLLSSASLTEKQTYQYEPTEVVPQSLNYQWEADGDWYIQGNVEMSIYYQINTDNSQINFSLSKINLQGQEEFLTTCVYGGRVTMNTDVTLYQNVYCPLFAQIHKGEKLALTVTSNLFPVIARTLNSNSKQQINTAEITIFHSADYPSQISLPLESQ